jgi:hypothetical protein
MDADPLRGSSDRRGAQALTSADIPQREFLEQDVPGEEAPSAMFDERLPKETRAALGRVATLPLPRGTYLAGGTAVALQLGHRVSDDIDLFTPEAFEPAVLVQALRSVGRFKLERTSWGTILGWINHTRFSLFYYRYPQLVPLHRWRKLVVADLRDVAAMKIAALSDRGARKDFIDLYFMCQGGLALEHMLALYDRKYGTLKTNLVHVYKSLVYFDEAETQDMPVMLRPFRWRALTTFFEREVRRLMAAGRSSASGRHT